MEINKINIARYDYLNYCRNVLLDILRYANDHDLNSTTIPYRDNGDEKTFSKICETNAEEGIKWLRNNGYEETVYESNYKNTFFSLISDFFDFYSISIDQAFEKNIVVAWSLLRRPLQENLAYIDWLYLKKYEPIKIMLDSTDVKDYDLNYNKNLREKIVKEVYKEIKDDDFDVYNFRYSKEDYYSLNGILNGATHLITTRNKNFKTVPSNLNFVFKDYDDIEKCINYYFSAVPLVMHYAITTIMATFNDIAGLKPYTNLMNDYNLRLKDLKAMQTMSLEDAIKIAQIEYPIICPKCGHDMRTLDDWQAFAYKSVRCKNCNNEIKTFGYIFDFEEITYVDK